jgi:hypothetical protein
MSEEHKEQETDDQQYPESRQTETWNKDVGETGRWGSRSKKEIWLVALITFCMIGATVAAVVVIATRDDGSSSSDEMAGETKIDPVTGLLVSAYEVPVPPKPTLFVSDQHELDYLRDQLAQDINLSKYLEVIPTTVAELTGKADVTTADPYVRAAAWLVTVDTTNAKEQTNSRFALAAIYYVTGGAAWTDKTNWLTEKHHCEWYGVTCCQNLLASAKCVSTSFDGIVEIDLYKNNLAGPIPESIALLKELQAIFLSENAMTGSIPGSVFAQLPQFNKLYVQHNQLTGTVPADLDTNGIFGTSNLRFKLLLRD